MTALNPFAHLLFAARQWRLLLLWSACMLIPTAIIAVPVWQLMAGSLDHVAGNAALAQQLDATVLADLMAVHGKSAVALNHLAIIALVVTLLMSPLLAGMASAAARAARLPGFGELLSGAVSDYPRMLRMLLWGLLPLVAAGAAGAAMLGMADAYAANAVAESDAMLVQNCAALLALLVLVLAHATIDAGRAALALERDQRSAIRAWAVGCVMLVRRPLASLGGYLVISAIGLALAALLGAARVHLAGVGWPAFVAALVLTQVIVMTIGWMRCARLFALIAVARKVAGAGAP